MHFKCSTFKLPYLVKVTVMTGFVEYVKLLQTLSELDENFISKQTLITYDVIKINNLSEDLRQKLKQNTK